MYQQLRPLYRVREVPPEEYSTKTVLVFEDEKASKKGSKGLFEKREVRRVGRYYDVTLRGQRGSVRLDENEFKNLGLVTNGIPLADDEGNLVRVEQ